MEREHVIPSLHWDRETILRMSEKVCKDRGLPEPRLLRFSNAAVLTAGKDAILRVDDINRNVWVGEHLAELTTFLFREGVNTPPPVSHLLGEKQENYYFSFYERIEENDSLTESQRAKKFGESLFKLHSCSLEKFLQINTEKTAVNHVDGIFQRLHESRENGVWKQTSLSDKNIEFLELKISEIFEKIYSNEEWQKASPVVLHGDAHLGNSIVRGESLFLIDFEYVSCGPAFLDHLHILLSDIVFRSNFYPSFFSGYGIDLTPSNNDLEAWIQLVSIPYIVWTASVGLRSDGHRKEADRRMRWLAEGLGSNIVWEKGF